MRQTFVTLLCLPEARELQLKKDTLQSYVLDNSRLQQRIDELERMKESHQGQYDRDRT